LPPGVLPPLDRFSLVGIVLPSCLAVLHFFFFFRLSMLTLYVFPSDPPLWPNSGKNSPEQSFGSVFFSCVVILSVSPGWAIRRLFLQTISPLPAVSLVLFPRAPQNLFLSPQPRAPLCEGLAATKFAPPPLPWLHVCKYL